MAAIEIIATVFGLLCVWLTIRQNIWCWPTGLVQVVLFIWIFFQAKLYSDVGLHVIYVVLSIYGWWYWLHGKHGELQVPVTRSSLSRGISWVVLGLFFTGVLGWLMIAYTDAALPYWDAATTVFSLIAQYFMARKRLESWLFWIAVDVMAIGVYITKELYVTSGLYSVFLVLAVMGWFAWKRTLCETTDSKAAV